MKNIWRHTFVPKMSEHSLSVSLNSQLMKKSVCFFELSIYESICMTLSKVGFTSAGNKFSTMKTVIYLEGMYV